MIGSESASAPVTDFSDISYLSKGNERQRRCHDLLVQTRVMDTLAPYSPLVVGTIPLGIDTAASDIDIVCEVRDTRAFAEITESHFGRYEDFEVRFIDDDRLVCRFSAGDEQIEIYGSPIPSNMSEGWRHMIVEARLLAIFGPDFQSGIVALKERGIKTEPAFALALGLDGDPYRAVLELEDYTDCQLTALIRR